MAIIDSVITEDYALYNGSNMEVMPTLPDGCVHFSIYSPPFPAAEGGGLYHYSSSPHDLSNAGSYDEFFEMYELMVGEIHRLTVPGRVSAVHCMDVPTGNSGKDAMFDAPGDIIRLHCQCRKAKCSAPPRRRALGLCGHGWFEFVARYSIWKEPLTVRNRLMIKTLAHKTIVEDSSRCSNASADYLLVFRKRGNNPIPITHPTGFSSYAGEREIPKDVLRYKDWKGSQLENRYSHWIWRQYASAFWDDIRLDRVLPYREARDEEDEKHVHPLQLDVYERCLHLWSNLGETVLEPFAGVGSGVAMSRHLGRRAIGIELKPSYFRQAVWNIANVELGADDGQFAFEFTQENTRVSFDEDGPEEIVEEIEDDWRNEVELRNWRGEQAIASGDAEAEEAAELAFDRWMDNS